VDDVVLFVAISIWFTVVLFRVTKDVENATKIIIREVRKVCTCGDSPKAVN